LGFVTISAVIIGVGLLVLIVHIIYVLTKWSSELQAWLLVELKNLKLEAISNNDDSTVKTVEELEYVMNEFKHTLISSRELWELISALITLATTIIATIAGLHSAP